MKTLKPLIAKFEAEYADWCYGTWVEAQYRPDSDACRRPINRVRFLYEMIPVWIKHELIGRAMCRWFGHGDHYHSEDWGGPETGGMAGYCDRCGFSFRHILY